MTLRTLAALPQEQISGIAYELPKSALARWDSTVQAAETTDNTISMLDPIGEAFEGVTAKRISAALRAIGKRDVVVNLNSPGGELHEGFAIYNMLREHEGKVTVKVLGLAASAASVIAMAGDDIQIAKAGFFMVHSSWVMAMGNKATLRAAAQRLEPFDAAMASVYADRTGIDIKQITAMMDQDTWISSEQAIESGFATALLGAGQIVRASSELTPINAKRKLEKLAANASLGTRKEIRELIQAIEGGTPGAAINSTPGAAETPLISGTSELELALAYSKSILS